MNKKRNIREEINNRSFKDIYIYIKKTLEYMYKVNKPRFILIMLLETISTVIPVVLLLLFQNILNKIILKEIPIYYLISFCVLLLTEQIIKHFVDINNNNFRIDIRRNSEKRLYDKVSKLRIEDFENKHLHNTSNRANYAINNFINIFDNGKNVIFDIINLIIYTTIIAVWKPLFLPIILIIPVINIIFILKVLKENFIKMWETTESFRKLNYYNYATTKHEFLSEIKILNISGIFKKKHADVVDDVQNKMNEIDNSNTTQTSKMNVLGVIYKIIYTIYLVIRVVRFNLKIGTFNTYFMAFSNINMYTNKVTTNLLNINIDLLEVKEFFDFIEYDNKYKDGAIKINYINTIEFKNVSYKYNNLSKEVLKDVSFKINKGEKIAIIGENGSGKSTLLKLLTKTYQIDEGKIYINGININDIETSSLREQISMLNQDFNIFEESLEFNIYLKDAYKNNKDLYKYIPFKKLKERIKRLPKEFKTVLGSWFGEGVNLSKGEMQKVALSRVFYKKNNCIILDEPNSYLDPKSEVELFDYMFNDLKDKICISVLHDLNYLNIMDKIIMLHDGEVIAYGIHRDLYIKNIQYMDFYNLKDKY